MSPRLGQAKTSAGQAMEESSLRCQQPVREIVCLDMNSSITSVWERLALDNLLALLSHAKGDRKDLAMLPLSAISHLVSSMEFCVLCGCSQIVEVEVGWEDQQVWGGTAAQSGLEHTELEKVREEPLRWRRQMYEVRWKGWV